MTLAGNSFPVPITCPAACPVPAWWGCLGPARLDAAPAGRAGMPGVAPTVGGNGARHRGIFLPGQGGWPA